MSSSQGFYLLGILSCSIVAPLLFHGLGRVRVALTGRGPEVLKHRVLLFGDLTLALVAIFGTPYFAALLVGEAVVSYNLAISVPAAKWAATIVGILLGLTGINKAVSAYRV